MSSSPRFKRGTSVIAALVFAAILGAVALSLNALQSNSANTAALPAAAANPAGAIEQSCVSGMNYNLTVGPAYTVQNVGSDVPVVTQNTLPSTKPEQTQVCPSNAQALEDAEVGAHAHVSTSGAIVGNLPATFNETPLVSTYDSCNTATGKETTRPTTGTTGGTAAGTTCTYMLQSGNTYQLQNGNQNDGVQGQNQTGPWMCHVRFYDPNQTTPSQECWTKNVPLGNGVNETPPTVPGASGTQQTPAAGATVSPDSAVINNTPPPCSTTGAQPTASANSITVPCASQTGGLSINNSAPCSSTTGQASADSITVPCGPSIPTTPTPTAPQGPCQNGTAMTASGCPTPTPNPVPGGAVPAGGGGGVTGGGTGSGTGGLGNAAGLLGSFLSGLIKGITPCTQQTSSLGGNGTTLVPVQVLNPTTGQITTTYVQQQTTSASQPCAQQQQAPYGTGTNGAACNAPPAVPQCAVGATAQPTSSQGNGCVDGYQCVPTSSTFGQTPTPQVSCSPQTADVGQSVAITYSCVNATGSTGAGFITNNQLTGSTSTILTAPPAGTNTANFGLTCTNGAQVASAQCSVQVNQPAIDLVADPQFVQSGATASVGWVTAGMQSCVISSPTDQNFTEENAGNTSANGVAQTDSITANTEFDLTCQTLGGQTKVASTIVSLGNATSTSAAAQDVTVNSTADGTTVNHGGTVTVTWSDTSSPTDSAVALWLIDLRTEEATALIAGDQALSGSYSWQLPASGSTCDETSLAPCATDLVAGDSYSIEAAVYNPADASLANTIPSGSVGPTYTDYGYTTNSFTIGQ